MINSILAMWIVKTVQNKITNKRVLKDHMISELKETRNEYRSMLNKQCKGEMHSLIVLPWFKLMNIKSKDLLSIAQEKYKISPKMLEPYQIELRELITEFEEFTKTYKSNSKVNLSDSSQTKAIQFQQSNNHIFNTLIIRINDSD